MNTAELAMMYLTGKDTPAAAKRQLDREDRKFNELSHREKRLTELIETSSKK